MERKTSCPSRAALEEYAVAIRRGAPDHTVEGHLKACKRCRSIAAKLEKEADTFLAFLHSARAEQNAPADCPDTLTIAAYLDKALDPAQRKLIEQHVALCRPCLQTLIAIYRETSASGARETEPAYGADPVPMAGQTKVDNNPALEVPIPEPLGDTADAEPRKKRLSSDFD